MPRLPIDYSRTIIYKLVHKDDLDDVNVYVGHTTDFTKRKNAHKICCNLPSNKGYNSKKYQFIRENGGWYEWVMLKIEDYPCKDVYEATNRERYWVKELKPKLNSCEPGRTIKEYYVDNKEKIAEREKEYYQNNREKIAEREKEYRENNRDKIIEYRKEYQKNNKEKIAEHKKEYYENNRETKLEKCKEYRQNNKEKILEYRQNNREKILEKIAEKIECDKCKSIVCRGDITRHKKTKKCQNHVSQ